MRSYFRFLLPVAVLLGAISCQEKPNGPEEPEDTAICLSSEATANCYIITAAGEYYFDATVMGNGASTDGIYPRSLATESAELVWQTSAGMISGVRAEEGKIHFTASNTPGNALIAACNTSGDIIWSWHIWHPAETPGSVTAKSGYEIMNMNLGALNSTLPADYDEASAGSQIYGMLYQWGRKDPFPAAASLTGDTSTTGAPLYDADGSPVSISNSSWTSTADNSIAYSIAHPTVCLSNYAQYSSSRDWIADGSSNDALWGNPNGLERDADGAYVNSGVKTVYDPCPAGWRVPPINVFNYVTPSSGISFTDAEWDVADINGDGTITSDDFRYGWNVNMADGTASFFPAAARYDGSYAMLYGSVSGYWGNYWSNCPGSQTTGVQGMGSSCLAFMVSESYDMLSPNASGSRADAYSVRCVKE